MRFDVIALFPELAQIATRHGVTGRAAKQARVTLALKNPHNYTHDRHRTVDDRPYGGGPGMVMMVPPLRETLRAARAAAPTSRVSYLRPQGCRFDQAAGTEMAARPGMILGAGRYEGIDQRRIDSEVDEEWTIGEYVLSGGELAAMVVMDAVTRLLPGVLCHELSAEQDSFVAGLLDHPLYTRPEEIYGQRVPAVLLQGNHEAIRRWRLKQALG